MKVCTTCGTEWPDDTRFCPNDGSTLRSASATASIIGSVIADRYHVEKKLGEGGMGAVYLGEHVKMGRKSAIKVMAQSMTGDSEAIARFNREAANAARINHPNVCAIYDFGETEGGLIYLAMEFIEGESLNDLLKREGALVPARAASILEQTGNALQAAHDMGIVHRDLKPDNIMIARRGTTEVVKVVDFGIAKAMGGEEGQKVTKTGLVVGTPEYMSPEQLSGDKLDGRSDIYSLALVFYRMITGALPFKADTAQETMIKRLTDDPMPLAEARPDLTFSSQLQRVMDRALQRMPADRYDSAAAFARDARAAVGAMPSAAAPPTPDTEGATQLIGATDGVTARLAATRVSDSAKTVATPATPIPATARASAAAPKRKPTVAIAATIGVLIVGGGVAVTALQHGDGGDPPEPGVRQPTDSPVAGDQTGGAAGGQTGGTQPTVRSDSPSGRTTGPVTDPGTTPTVPVVPPTRTAAEITQVSEELSRLLDQLFEDATRRAAMQRAETIYNDGLWPDSIRAAAASVVGSAHFDVNDQTQACQWISRAITYAPANGTYRQVRQRWGCGS